MSRAAVSACTYGLLLAGLSVVCLAVAVFGARVYGAPAQSEVFEFTAALALAFLAYGYLEAARIEARALLWLSVLQRYAVPIALGTLVALKLTPSGPILLAIPDTLLATWTLVALLVDARRARQSPLTLASAPAK